MDEIREYVNRMFAGLPKTKAVQDMKRNILENMQEHCEELLSQGKSKNEALGAVISQFGNIDEVKKALGVEDEPEERHYGFLETFFAYFSPDVLFWRALIHRSAAELAVFFSSVAVFLALGFFLNLWHPGWLVFWAAGLAVLLLDRRNPAKHSYGDEVRSRYGFLEFIFAYFDAVVLFWRILIRRSIPEAVVFFFAVAIHLALGFALNLWPVCWIVYPAAGLVAFLLQRRGESQKEAA